MVKTGPSIEAIIEEFQMELEERDFANVVEVDLSPDFQGGICLDRIWSRQRGQGLADKALRLLMAICDKYNTEIQVIPHPLDEETREDLLRAWYERHGFIVNTTQKPLKMRRKAHSPAP